MAGKDCVTSDDELSLVFEDMEDGSSVEGMGNATRGRKAMEAEERRNLMKRKEQKAVNFLRVAVYLVVVVTAVVVVLWVFFHTREEEENTFEVAFETNANKLAEAFLDSVDHKIDALSGLSSTITNYALTTGSSFPNVTIENWETISMQTRIQADGMVIQWLTLVAEEDRKGWEAYANDTKGWRERSYAAEMELKRLQDEQFGIETFQEDDEHAAEGETKEDEESSTDQGGGPKDPNRFFTEIHGLTKEGPRPLPVGNGPYAVSWQMSPVMDHNHLLNVDLFTSFGVGSALNVSMESQQAVLSAAEDIPGPANETEKGNRKRVSVYNEFLQLGQFRHNEDFYKGGPTTALLYPVFDAFSPNRTVAGFLLMPLYWRLDLSNVLPEGLNGIIAVIQNSQGQTFSYRVDGPKATFLGGGDHHSSSYDDMAVYQSIAEALEANNGPESHAYDAVNLNKAFCSYSISLYPSQIMEDVYVTKGPAVYAAAVAGIFLFTLAVLAAFDCLVARRQRIVMKKAVERGALVSSLYPKEFTEQLFQDEHQGVGIRWRASTAPSEDVERNKPTKTGVMAERYENSTILFMDLAGFTSWSSSRSTEDVFLLLETLYFAFDKIATKLDVYKIETVGDCYVCVTGVPKAQDDHAVRMCRFAAACQVKMTQLIATKLTDPLGPDTSILALRAGMSSGPITGGILRGDKGRFQLFGDNINVASRMESNGVPGKIHISQSCADELIRHGYQSWLELRPDKVFAKGKGEMTTYFVNVEYSKSVTTRSSFLGSTKASAEEANEWSVRDWNQNRTDASPSVEEVSKKEIKHESKVLEV
ncbi:Receptor-type guanylate cyclase gcy [Seminavis robusta]|uniref:Receptor-type guanylate cyclase gcy n=1 Tax=Seminavis robusta TaxID=568900 RepID=A0A9N8DF26_9STRA|nr:Receptor-type guanylate cyclase gcy [Seminavis robusta]|eukprot:Sro93_g048680.1 Receptor-type guanylate cyclase gcy (817) ;mRNA; r:102474-105304